jgi:hypothetical protein
MIDTQVQLDEVMLQKHDTCDFSRIIEYQSPPLYHDEPALLSMESITAIGRMG